MIILTNEFAYSKSKKGGKPKPTAPLNDLTFLFSACIIVFFYLVLLNILIFILANATNCEAIKLLLLK